MTDARKALADKIAQIDLLLEREEHDSGYQAFVHIRKIWPELKAAALPPAPMPEREGMREALKRADSELSWRGAGENNEVRRLIRAALAPHDKTDVLKFEITSYPSELMGEGPASDLRLLADLFSESAHETWSKDEIVNIIKDAIRLGAPASPAVLKPEGE